MTPASASAPALDDEMSAARPPLASWLEGTNDATQMLLRLAEAEDVISLAGGLPAPEVFPHEAVAAAYQSVLLETPAGALQYGPSTGVTALRDKVAAHYRDQGLPVSRENVMITSGSQQGLSLMGMIFLQAGDPVTTEQPTFLAAIDAWRVRSPDFQALTWQGDRPDAGPRTPRFCYVLPNFHNPTGETLAEERRAALLADARARGYLLLEDNPYGALRYEGQDASSLLALDRHAARDGVYQGHVVHMGTFSKTLAPALRVGWTVAAPWVLAAMAQAKQGADLCTSPMAQMAACRLIDEGVEEANAEATRANYRAKRDAMLAALARTMPAGAQWNTPEGGMFIWLGLPAGMDCTRLLDAAIERGVAYVPGHAFYPDGERAPRTHARLNFTNPPLEAIEPGIARLAEAMADIG